MSNKGEGFNFGVGKLSIAGNPQINQNSSVPQLSTMNVAPAKPQCQLLKYSVISKPGKKNRK